MKQKKIVIEDAISDVKWWWLVVVIG